MVSTSSSIILVFPESTAQMADATAWLRSNYPDTKPSQVEYLNEDLEGIKIDHIRQLKQRAAYSVSGDSARFFVLLGCENMTMAAQQASLKLLEEPPEKTTFMLVTSLLNQLLPTIQSRCKIIHVAPEQDREIDQSSIDLYNSIPTRTWGELITLSDQYTTKQECIELCSSLLYNIYDETIQNGINDIEDKSMLLYISKSILVLQKTRTLLEANSHVKLTITECFFEIKKIYAGYI